MSNATGIAAVIISFLSFVLLLALKVCGVAPTLTWFWVCCPLMVVPGAIVVITISMIVFAVFAVVLMCMAALAALCIAGVIGWMESK